MRMIAVASVIPLLLAGCVTTQSPAARIEAPDPAAVSPAATTQAPVHPLPTQGSIHFTDGSDRLDVSRRHELDRHADWLRANRRVTATLRGFAPPGGSKELALALALRRAHAVEQALVAKGVPGSRLRALANTLEVTSCLQTDCAGWRNRVDIEYRKGD